MENHLAILAEGLDRKIQVLKQIKECCDRQAEVLSQEEVELEAFDKEFEEKDKLIEEMTRLDDGFDPLYKELSKELQDNKAKYAAQIKELQERIEKVTELSVSIQTQETRNKKAVEEYFARTRNGIRQNRQSSKAAYDYYKNMSGISLSTSRFMDDKH